MIDLKTIMKNNPGCLASRSSFKSVLTDMYPNEKRLINILTIIYEAGMVTAIKSRTRIPENDYNSLVTQIENDYGIPPKYSREAIRCWSTALDVELDMPKPAATAVSVEPIRHAQIIEHTVVEGNKSDYETVVRKSGHLTITKFIGFDEKEIVIPKQIDGAQVTVIGEEAFAKCTGVERIIIPEGIVKIENGAFYQCTSLEKIVLPSSLRIIGSEPKKQLTYSWNGVFEGCPIKSVILPAELTELGKRTFAYCKELTTINLPNTLRKISESCFVGCVSLGKALLPDNLLEIGERAFESSGLSRIDFPTTVRTIGKNAFLSCVKLTAVHLHEGVETIEDHAFENCKALREITIPRSVTKIGSGVFDITGWYQP